MISKRIKWKNDQKSYKNLLDASVQDKYTEHLFLHISTNNHLTCNLELSNKYVHKNELTKIVEDFYRYMDKESLIGGCKGKI